MFQIRPAKLSDAGDIYNIWSRGWRYAYGKILSPEFLEKRVGPEAVQEKIQKFPEKMRKEADKGNIFLVLTDNDKVIGFVSFVLKVPKFDKTTLSPFFKASFIIERVSSTAVLACFLSKRRVERACIISSLFITIPLFSNFV